MAVLGCATLAAVAACSGPEEAARVELSVHAVPGVDVTTTNLGYAVELSEARLVVQDLEFTQRGVEHASSLMREAVEWLVPTAYAHPGHTQDGEITGELLGRVLFSWLPRDDENVGTATLLTGRYESASFTFAAAADGVGENDPLFGHTALLRGRATKGDEAVEFSMLMDAPASRKLLGVPFELTVTEGTDLLLGLRLLPLGTTGEGTLFDGIDFVALDGAGTGAVVLDAASEAGRADAYNLVRRRLLTHDFYDFIGYLPGSGS